MKSLLPKPYKNLIGHRGAPKLALENTLSSFQKAVEAGLNWVELDIMQTRDGELVVFHDQTLERLAGIKSKVAALTLKEIQQIPLINNERIPTLSAALDYLFSQEIIVNIEIKQASLTKLLKILATFNNYAAKVLLSSFHLPYLIALTYQAPEINLGLLTNRLTDKISNYIATGAFSTLHCAHKHLVPTHCPIPIFAYTINCPLEAQLAFKHGASAIFSDDPYLPLQV